MSEVPQPPEPSDELPAPSDNPGAPPDDKPSEPKEEPSTDPEVPAPSDDQPQEDTDKDMAKGDESTETPSKENNDESDKKDTEEANQQDVDQSDDKPQENGDGDGDGDNDSENKEEPPPEDQKPVTESANDDTSTTTDNKPTDEGVMEISQEEKDIHTEINKEKEAITKCIDNMVEAMSKFENESQEKNDIINETFDALIKSINDRRNILINELKDNILTAKSDGLKQIESLKQYQQSLNDMDSKYQSLINPTKQTENVDEKDKTESLDASQRKEQILSIKDQFDSKHAKTEFEASIKLRLDTKDIESMVKNIGSIRIGKPGDPEYDEEKVPSIIDTNLELLLAEIPVKKLYRWALKSGDDYTWKSRCQRTVILFYQNKTSYKVRMVVKENESEKFLMNQWVATNELVEKEKLVWLWSSYDATLAEEEGDEKKGYTKWCAKFFDDIAFERFEDQYNQARKINIQVLENEEKIRKQKEKQDKLKKKYEAEVSRDEEVNTDIHDEDAQYYENDEKLCFEMDVWKTYLWSKDASGKGSWKGYADKSLLQFFENRNNKKIRIVLREHESKELKLNHWIPTDITLKSRGDQMWEWQVYDDLATKFLKNTTLKLATICGTFIDKKDTTKFKELFEKYQKINQKAEAI